jgi:Zn-dependent protease with chaperone function
LVEEPVRTQADRTQPDTRQETSAGAVPVQANGLGLIARSLVLDALRHLYPLVTGLGTVVLFVFGGFVPVFRRWLGDEIDLGSGRDVVRTLGGYWIPRRGMRRNEDLGLPLTRAQAPLLFDEIHELARRLGARPPAQTHLTYLPCCGVVDWGRRGHEPVLVIGLPLLDVLTRNELRAVLVHELAHLARGDAARIAWAVAFIDDLSEAMTVRSTPSSVWQRYSPLGLWSAGCLALGRACLGPVVRGQEARADRAAASVAGGDAAASALVKTALVQPLFREVLDTYDARSSDLPNLYALFRQFWSRLPEPLMTAMRHRLLTDRTSQAHGAHPDLIDRLAAVQSVPPRPCADATEPATHVLGDIDAIERQLHARLFDLDRPEPSVFHRAGS